MTDLAGYMTLTVKWGVNPNIDSFETEKNLIHRMILDVHTRGPVVLIKAHFSIAVLVLFCTPFGHYLAGLSLLVVNKFNI